MTIRVIEVPLHWKRLASSLAIYILSAPARTTLFMDPCCTCTCQHRVAAVATGGCALQYGSTARTFLDPPSACEEWRSVAWHAWRLMDVNAPRHLLTFATRLNVVHARTASRQQRLSIRPEAILTLLHTILEALECGSRMNLRKRGTQGHRLL